GADRPHQVENLATLLALQGSGMEVADDLRDGLLDSEELLAEEVKYFERLILVDSLGADIGCFLDVLAAGARDHVVDASVSELGNRRIVADALEVVEERSAPILAGVGLAILLDDAREGLLVASHTNGSSRLCLPTRGVWFRARRALEAVARS